jgi:multidrug efflux pump subunit AcrA (membrane-fusion protein)
MASRRATRIIALGAVVVAAGVGGYFLWRPEPAPPVVGVVRATEVRVAAEVGGQLAEIKVHKGDRVRAGDIVAELSALELTASVAQARAALAAASATRPLCAGRRHVGAFRGQSVLVRVRDGLAGWGGRIRTSAFQKWNSPRASARVRGFGPLH